MGVLYVVATPLGNLEDITLRALRILKEVSLIAAEDTRRTKKLLAYYGIRTPLTSYYEHSKLQKLDSMLEALGKGDVALVSDAGTPGINDPGFELVRACVGKGIRVIPVPGPSIVSAVLSVAGITANQFVYCGYLPAREVSRRTFLRSLATDPRTLFFLEVPHRMKRSLGDILAILGDRNITVCREITKVHEEVFRGTVKQAIERFVEPRGEFALVLEGFKETGKSPDLSALKERMQKMLQEGITAIEVIEMLRLETGLPKRELYHLWLSLKARHSQ